MPRHLARVPSAIEPPPSAPIRYRTDAPGTYELGFTYGGRGINKWDDSPDTKWHCGGYY